MQDQGSWFLSWVQQKNAIGKFVKEWAKRKKLRVWSSWRGQANLSRITVKYKLCLASNMRLFSSPDAGGVSVTWNILELSLIQHLTSIGSPFSCWKDKTYWRSSTCQGKFDFEGFHKDRDLNQHQNEANRYSGIPSQSHGGVLGRWCFFERDFPNVFSHQGPHVQVFPRCSSLSGPFVWYPKATLSYHHKDQGCSSESASTNPGTTCSNHHTCAECAHPRDSVLGNEQLVELNVFLFCFFDGL